MQRLSPMKSERMCAACRAAMFKDTLFVAHELQNFNPETQHTGKKSRV